MSECEGADAYRTTAEFYDILQAERDSRLVAELYGGRVAAARGAVVDVGAGSGTVSLMALACSGAPVHAVEPSAVMRSLLLTRLAWSRADRRARVTVHPGTLPDAEIPDSSAELVVCHNVVPTLDGAARDALWEAAARVLEPGGLLLMDRPRARAPRAAEVAVFTPVRVGADTYEGEVRETACEDGAELAFTYTVRRGERVVRRRGERFLTRMLPQEVLTRELGGHGLRCEETGERVLVARGER
ncbi:MULTISPECIES: class I SAM-dependent methyltransferase [Streptomyces]|uniref:Class I SAM-dependent methyltransferase n=1 Tax=Streptomyces evansiae TaxID=3075535 RepID=A0ABD5E2X4_9ACTN|nr:MULTISPECIES: class I SAM-dependent methyltransferase [unclassified Streptomyces]ASY36440.1 methyltransferase type 12 [Streptomyces sp. CLI2509]MDT0415433.1 class I SAM-dependent methyltransferase [Streptomyces sp. DSM 41982]MYX23772.1 methyltransferase domain-containing protein [Streptomyces sp. SID8380]SCD71315.1 Methyltransferase domain-containing protein [Streptomyces sp. SolWspMP-sol7th]